MPTYTQPPEVGSPTCCALYWQCPTLMQATPGVHRRGCLARPRWGGLDATGKLLAVPNPVLAATVSASRSLPHCCKFSCFLNTTFQADVFFILEVYWKFWLMVVFHFHVSCFGQMYSQLSCEAQSHTLSISCCSYLGRWCYPGCLPWVGWASTLPSFSFCGYRHFQINLN